MMGRMICGLAVALPTLLLCSPISAAVNRWTSVGPSGGWVRSIVVHPTEPSTAWTAVQPGGIFRTRDGGASWQKLPVGPVQNLGSSASLIAVDRGSPGSLLASASGGFGALWRSTDGGDSWSTVGRPGTNGTVQALAISPGSPARAFAANSTNGLFRSTDGGVSWTLVWSVPFQQSVPAGVLAVTVDPLDPNVVYAAGGVSGFVKSTDGGLTFTSRPGPAFARSIAIHPTQTQVLYAATPGVGVSRSSDGGATWTTMNSGLTDTNTRSIAIDPRFPSQIWVATDGSGVFRSNDDARSWLPAASGLTNPFANAVAFGAGGDMGLVGYTGAGISRTVDHGAVWSDTPLPAGYVQKLAAGIGGQPVAGMYGVGVARTTDRGKSWSVGSAGLARPDFADLAVSRRDPNHMAMGTFGAIFSSQDGGSTWVSHEVIDSNCLSLAFDPADARTIYAALITAEILRSRDGGSTWSKASDFSAFTLGTYASLLRSDPTQPGVLFASTGYSGLLRSTDAGQSWVSVQSFDGQPFVALEFDASDPQRVYASDGFSFFRSGDRGLSWTRVGASPGGLITSLSSDPTRLGSLYAAVDGAGVFQTNDFGATWTPLNDGLPIYSVSAVQVDARDPSWVYVATNGAGVFAMQRSGTAGPCVSDAGTLCLNGDRFRVRSSWRVPAQATSGSGTSVRLTGDTGYFWFFSSNNVEIVVKVVDGTPDNGKYWVFAGALSDVEYTITVTDT
ncbi:MAG TPA: hypothetical protein VIZ58_01580, partial [Thermoanaerobaculia bacterium]